MVLKEREVGVRRTVWGNDLWTMTIGPQLSSIHNRYAILLRYTGLLTTSLPLRMHNTKEAVNSQGVSENRRRSVVTETAALTHLLERRRKSLFTNRDTNEHKLRERGEGSLKKERQVYDARGGSTICGLIEQSVHN